MPIAITPRLAHAALALAGWLVAVPAAAGIDNPECVVPAKVGGGFDLTCKLTQAMLRDAQPGREPLRLSYLPGGIGAVAFDRAVSQRQADPGRLVAFSSGSLLNLVQGKFGPHQASDVRWLATLGTDYGVIAVRRESRIQSLKDLQAALRQDMARVAFGAGGTVGSQDWIKAALIVRAAGRDYKSMRFISFEGGGEALAALRGGHVDVFTGDAAEARQLLEAESGANVRLIAVLAEQRLPGPLAGVPTAREQGLDLVWPTVRGLYLGPGVNDADHRAWTATLQKAMATPGFARLREQHGLYPLSLTGPELERFIAASVADYRGLAAQFHLRVQPPR
jgi:putative tricarboxylic transport membrane protein